MRVECSNESRWVSTSDAAPHGFWLGEPPPARRDRLSVRSGLNVAWRRVETQAGVSLPNADSRVDANDIAEINENMAPEDSAATVGSANFMIPPDFDPHDIRGEKNKDRSVIEPEMPADV